MNTTVTVHEAPAATLAPQVLVSENELAYVPASVIPNPVPLKLRAALPEFFSAKNRMFGRWSRQMDISSNTTGVLNWAVIDSARYPSNGAIQNIVLADGTYDSSSPFSDANGSHLYAQHVGGAVLTAGLVIGGNFGSGGGSVEGVAFNVSSSSKTFRQAA